MVNKISCLFIILSLLFTSVKVNSQAPKSDFSHIEIIIDSADFQKLILNTFIRNSLGKCSYDTMQTSPLVISYYINGQENFIHFNPNKGYFAKQLGSAYIIFQTRWPGQGKLLEKSWKSFTKDSLISYDIKNTDFTLTETIFKKHGNLHLSNTNHLIPMLSSYSIETYKKWGLGDSAEVSMKQFIGADSADTKKLFAKMLSVRLSITKNELIKLTSMMKVVEYKMKRNKFIKTGQPEISFTINNNENENKVKELVLLLNKHKGRQRIDLGNILLLIKNNKAKFLFNYTTSY
ncbi:MAG TPA: DUF5829 family protein [Chitinophagaceae bacterium]|nr:DUF5829 family protein [Chitinophagaceae bacterium]